MDKRGTDSLKNINVALALYQPHDVTPGQRHCEIEVEMRLVDFDTVIPR